MKASKEDYFKAFRGRCIARRGPVQVWLVHFTKDSPGLPKVAIAKQSQCRTLDFDREVSILQALSGSHPNIVSYYHHIVTKDRGFIFMEWCAGGSLAEEIARREAQKAPWSDEELRSHFAGLIGAMSVVHNLRIVHRDLKPENIFLTDTGVFKLGDFGESKQIRQGSTDVMATLRGTREYASPQAQNVGIVSNSDCYEADVWMLGRTFYEMAVGCRRPDLNIISPSKAAAVYEEMERTLEQASRAADLTRLILAMMGLEGVERPSFAALQQALMAQPCAKCGSEARRREPFPCGHVMCGTCFLQFLAYIKQCIGLLQALVCPFCNYRLSLAYFQRNDYDEEATAHVTKLFLEARHFECPFCGEIHLCYSLFEGKLLPYSLTCGSQVMCSLCQAKGGHQQAHCPQFAGSNNL